MKELTIEISLSKTGILEAETFGFIGPICEQELKEILKNDFLIEEIDKKEDYYKQEETIASIKKMINEVRK